MKFFGILSVCCVALSVVSSVQAQPTELRIDRELGPARITLNAEAGLDYQLEGAAMLQSGPWDVLATLRLEGGTQTWLDSVSVLEPKRFYRAVKLGAVPPEAAADFRLIDHLGRSRWLYYNVGAPGIRAVVLIFTGTDCGPFREMVPTIKALTNRFQPEGVLFWLIDANAGDSRADILAEATALGMSNGPPILHDPAQIVARTYQAGSTPEAIAIDTGGVVATIFYRGAIDDRVDSSAVSTTQSYLSNALTSLLASANVSPRQT